MKKILVVEDDPIMRETIQDILSFNGYEVDCAKEGVDAIEKIYDTNYDLIITDLLMPRRDGYDVIHSAIGQNPNARIMAISGGGSISANEYLAMAKDIGAKMVLSKPFDVDHFITMVRTTIELDK